MAKSFPVYLYTGPEFGQRNDAVEKVKSSLKKKYDDVDEHLFYLLDTPFSEIINILSGGTLFSAATCVVCKNAELLKKKDDIALLSEWIATFSELSEEEANSSVLIFVSDEISVDSKLDKLIPNENKKKFWEMFEKDKLPWVQNFFQKNGFGIEKEAAQLILDMIENNTESLKNECSRFFVCFQKEHVITTEDVESVLINNREESAFTLFNLITNSNETAQKRFENGLVALQKIGLSKEKSSVLLIAGLASCFRKLILWHDICPNGYSADSFSLKSKGFYSSSMQNQYRNAAKIWTSGQATAILAVLASADMEIRSGGSLMEEVILQKMLYEIVIKKGASSQALNYLEDF